MYDFLHEQEDLIRRGQDVEEAMLDKHFSQLIHLKDRTEYLKGLPFRDLTNSEKYIDTFNKTQEKEMRASAEKKSMDAATRLLIATGKEAGTFIKDTGRVLSRASLDAFKSLFLHLVPMLGGVTGAIGGAHVSMMNAD